MTATPTIDYTSRSEYRETSNTDRVMHSITITVPDHHLPAVVELVGIYNNTDEEYHGTTSITYIPPLDSDEPGVEAYVGAPLPAAVEAVEAELERVLDDDGESSAAVAHALGRETYTGPTPIPVAELNIDLPPTED